MQDPHTGQPLPGPPGGSFFAVRRCLTNEGLLCHQDMGFPDWTEMLWEGHLDAEIKLNLSKDDARC